LHTKEKFAQLYGYWEARIRVASGAGLHSAFWGKPANERWPPELDVEEVGGARPDTVIMTVHWRDAGTHRQRNRRFQGDDLSGGFHVFGAEWSPEGTVWYVDGVERARITDGAAEMAAEGPFYALLDLQVGLRGAVQPSAATPFPGEQVVDYVRIWRRPSGLLPAPPSGAAPAASAAASAAATAALCSMRATLAATVRPPVAAAMRSSTNGVTAPPVTPAPAASARAASMTGPSAAAGTSKASGTGVTTRMPLRCPNSRAARITSAASAVECSGWGTARPLRRDQKAGNSPPSAPPPMTVTPSVSSRSSVRGTSRKAFTPAQTVTTGWRARAPRSALSSPLSAHSRWTPPIPPVANTVTPAAAASASEADTVVAAAGQRCAAATARSRSAALRSAARRRGSSPSSTPTRGSPSSTTVRAATAPASRTTSSERRSASAPAGPGSPRRLNTVDSSATTGRPSATAAATSGETRTAGTAGSYRRSGCIVGARNGQERLPTAARAATGRRNATPAGEPPTGDLAVDRPQYPIAGVSSHTPSISSAQFPRAGRPYNAAGDERMNDAQTWAVIAIFAAIFASQFAELRADRREFRAS